MLYLKLLAETIKSSRLYEDFLLSLVSRITITSPFFISALSTFSSLNYSPLCPSEQPTTQPNHIRIGIKSVG